MSRARTFLFWLILVTLMCAAVFVCDVLFTSIGQSLSNAMSSIDGVIEHSYRIWSADYHHDLKPNVDLIATWGGKRYPMTTNSIGFKDRASRVVDLQSKARRILFIGDSFTEGVGIPYDKTFVGLIDRDLSKDGIEVLNAGVTSYSPSLYDRKIRYWVGERGLRIDEVFVFIDVSDIQDEAILAGLPNASPSTPSGPQKASSRIQPQRSAGQILRLAGDDFIRSHTTLIKGVLSLATTGAFLPERIDKSPNPENPRINWPTDERTYELYGREGVRLAQERMDDLLTFTKGRNIRLSVAVYPRIEEILAGNVSSKEMTVWRDWSARNGVDFINYYPRFMELGKAGVAREYFIPGDAHWNEKGHRVVAEGFLGYFKNRTP